MNAFPERRFDAAPQQDRASAPRVSIYDEVTARIVDELEAGRFPWVQPWDASAFAPGLPRNADSGRSYSGINILILWVEVVRRGFSSQGWLTFRQAQSAGGQVRKGERGTTIFYAARFTPNEAEASGGAVAASRGRGEGGGGARAGEARSVAPATEAYRPTDPQIGWALGQFIRNVRGVSLDPVLMRENWLAAYDFASDRGALFLSDHARSADPFGQVGTRSVSVQIVSVVRASERSFQVKWSERVYERGSLASSSRWTAMLTVAVRTPKSAEALRKNPLGLYVEAIDWSREYEAPGAALAEATPVGTVVPVAGADRDSGPGVPMFEDQERIIP